ncbi:MAG: hypothetical protein U0469_01560 [Candidatus Paceibacterota bacterium]|jgi:hypothetical protein
MITTNILAQIFGITFLFVGISIIFNRKSVHLVVEKMTREPGLLWFLGFVSIFLGSFILAFSNFYGDGLSFVLSIVGILAFLKGIYLLWIPGHSMRLWNKINDNKTIISISGIIITIISLYLIAKGFYF